MHHGMQNSLFSSIHIVGLERRKITTQLIIGIQTVEKVYVGRCFLWMNA
jgi:hypothetical protein